MVRLEARIQKPETGRVPNAPLPIILAPGYGPEFDRQVAEAKAIGARVVVSHLDRAPCRHEWVDGVDHTSRINAALGYCYARLSRQRRRIMLDDVIQDIQGVSIRPKQFIR
jgi:hypothetical protein